MKILKLLTVTLCFSTFFFLFNKIINKYINGSTWILIIMFGLGEVTGIRILLFWLSASYWKFDG